MSVVLIRILCWELKDRIITHERMLTPSHGRIITHEHMLTPSHEFWVVFKGFRSSDLDLKNVYLKLVI